MKKILFCMLLVLVLLSGCGSSSSAFDPETYKELGLTITAEIPEKFPKSLKIYNVSYIDYDEDIMVKTLFTHEPEAYEDDALGAVIRYRYFEWLNIQNKADMKVNGFTFIRSVTGEADDMSYYTRLSSEKANLMVKSHIGLLSSEMPYNSVLKEFEDKDLSFKSRKEVIDETDNVVEELKVPGLQLKKLYARDMDTLNENRIRSNQIKKEQGLPLIDYEFTENDEDYFLSYQQVIDDIPITQIDWLAEPGMDTVNTASHFEVQYDQERGLADIYASNLYQISGEKEEKTILAPEKAIEKYIEVYGEGGFIDPTTIYDISLEYIILYRDSKLTAVPVWMLSVASKVNTETVSGNIYENIAIDAADLHIYLK